MSSQDDANALRAGSIPKLPGALRLSLAALLVSALLAPPALAQVDPYALMRSDMVEIQIRQRGIDEPSILSAMKRVPRHRFVPETPPLRAYEDGPVEFASGQTLPQAYLSAQMIKLLNLDGSEKVLEIGTGSGYDAAILSRLASEVYTIDINRGHSERAKKLLRELGYDNVHVKAGDGYRGWPEKAPFDAILVTAAPERIPDALLEQLKVGGKMVLAVGGDVIQDLQVITMTADGPRRRRISPVVIEPMIDPQR